MEEDLMTDDDSGNDQMDVDNDKEMRDIPRPIMNDTRPPPIPARRQLQGCVGSALKTRENIYSELPSIKESADHFVLFDAPSGNSSGQENLISFESDEKCEEGICVLLPYTNFYKQPDANDVFRLRSELIRDAFKDPGKINTVQKLEKAIVSYNHPLGTQWKFSLLKQFENEDKRGILKTLLPKIVRLALDLPKLLTRPLPILKQGKAQQLSLTQKQIASLLANAFLCTFPKRSTMNKTMKYLAPVNFNSLFEMPIRKSRQGAQMEKLRCIIHYFQRCAQEPTGVVTFSRRYIPEEECREMFEERHSKLLVPSSGRNSVNVHDTIEMCGPNSLQIDFANKIIGGGVLGSGCVQEEIRFVICPELIASRLFVEELDNTEALVVVGAERYSEYSGYADTFRWERNYEDETKKDLNDRRQCSILAIDAQNFQNKETQFTAEAINRELFKALVGFYSPDGSSLPIATGNWGCGIFGGDPHLKAVLQMMAAAMCDRGLIYHTIGDKILHQDLLLFNHFALKNKITVGETYDFLLKYRIPSTGDQNVIKYFMEKYRRPSSY